MADRAPKNAIADTQTGLVTREWLAWLQTIADATTPPTPAPPNTPPPSTDTDTDDDRPGSGGGITIVNDYGSGTTNRVTKWLASQTLGDSSMTDTGGMVTVDGTLSATTLQGSLDASYLTGSLDVADGGTGLTTIATGDLIYGASLNHFAALHDVAVGSVLVSGGVSTAPAWSATPLVTDLTLTGKLKAADGTRLLPSITFANDITSGFYRAGPNAINLAIGAGDNIVFGAGGPVLLNTLAYRWGSIIGGIATADTFLFRDATGTIAQRGGTTAQTYRLYTTYTDASNYERLDIFGAAGGNFNILSSSSGTGVARGLRVGTSGTADVIVRTAANDRWYYEGATGHFKTIVDATYDIGALGATRPRNVYVASNILLGGQLQAQRGVLGGFNYAAVDPMLSYSGGFWIPRTNDLNQGYIYDYQDEFAFVDKRVGAVITVTSAVVPPESPTTLFRDDTGSLSWASGTSPFPITIEVDTLTTSINPAGNGFYNLGITYRPTGTTAPTNIKIEVWDSGAYVTRYDQAPPTAPIGSAWLSPRFLGDAVGGFGMKKVRLTLSGTNPIGPSDVFRLQRLMLYHPTSIWNPWHLHKLGGTLHGQIAWSAGNGALDHLLGPSDQPFALRPGAGQEFRIKDNAGTVRLTGTSLGFAVNGTLSVTGALTAGSFSGNGSALTNLNASALTTGLTALARGGTGFDASAVAKGGLLVGASAGTMALKTVGADGQVLTADAASAGGVTWAAAGAPASAVRGEIPSGAIDGVNAVFTTAAAYTGLAVYLNGLRQTLTTDYTHTTATTFTFAVAPIVGDTIRVDYN